MSAGQPRRSAGQNLPAFSRRRGQMRWRAAEIAHRAPIDARRAATGSWERTAAFGGGGWSRGGRKRRRRRALRSPESGESEPEATGHGEACGEVRCAPRDAVK